MIISISHHSYVAFGNFALSGWYGSSDSYDSYAGLRGCHYVKPDLAEGLTEIGGCGGWLSIAWHKRSSGYDVSDFRLPISPI